MLKHEKEVHGLDLDESDDVYSYQRSLLEYGMILRNFLDAVKEGDGKRVIRCWRFILPYLKADEAASRKYALEGIYLLAQIHVLLPPRDAHRLIWNRFVSTKSGLGRNYPIDKEMEFYIRAIKLIIRNLGGNAEKKTILDRYANSLTFNSELVRSYDDEVGSLKKSGRHTAQNITSDLQKVVKQLMEQDAFTRHPRRKYRAMENCPMSLLSKLDIGDLFTWINDHKKKIIYEKCAR